MRKLGWLILISMVSGLLAACAPQELVAVELAPLSALPEELQLAPEHIKRRTALRSQMRSCCSKSPAFVAAAWWGIRPTMTAISRGRTPMVVHNLTHTALVEAFA